MQTISSIMIVLCVHNSGHIVTSIMTKDIASKGFELLFGFSKGGEAPAPVGTVVVVFFDLGAVWTNGVCCASCTVSEIPLHVCVNPPLPHHNKIAFDHLCSLV